MNRHGLFAFTLTLGLLAACLPDRASWSPDGKTLHHICADGTVVATDGESGSSRTIFAEPGWKAVLCFAIAPAGAVLIAADRPGTDPNEPVRDLHLVTPDGAVRMEIVRNVSAEAGLAASADGRRVFCSRHDKAAAKWEFWMIEIADGRVASSRMLLSQLTGVGYPCSSADGRRVVLTFESSIGILDVEAGKVQTLVSAPKVTPPLYGVWVQNEKAVAYLETFAKRNDPNSGNDLAPLAVITVADKEIKKLGGGVSILRRPMVGSDGKTVYVTQALTQHESGNAEMGEIAMKDIQVVAFDTETGARTIVTSEPSGAFWPAPAPRGSMLAYYAVKPGTRGDWPDNLILRKLTPGDAQGADIPCGGN